MMIDNGSSTQPHEISLVTQFLLVLTKKFINFSSPICHYTLEQCFKASYKKIANALVVYKEFIRHYEARKKKSTYCK